MSRRALAAAVTTPHRLVGRASRPGRKPELNGDAIWPILVIILGIGLLSRGWETKPAE